MTLRIDVTEPLFLRHGLDELIINRGVVHKEMHIPYSDVEFSVEVVAGEVPVVRTKPKAQSSGNSCFACGGMTVRTGTCETCTSCGTSGGCG